MTTFFIDLWHDLREKRLWPVAVGLLAAIVAVPAVLFKPASDAVPQAIVPPKTNSAETLPVVAVDDGPTVGSRLESFNEKNPFKPMKDLAKAAATTSTSSASSGSSSGTGTGSSSGSGSAASPSSGGSASSGGASKSVGSSPGSGGSSGATPAPSAPTSGGTPVAPPAEWFHYTANFNFGKPGSPKKFKSAGSFTLLPDDTTAAIMFVGVTDDGKSALFFIADPGFQASGEGKCNVAGADCRYVALKLSDTKNEETFTAADGSVTYKLKLTSIQNEKVAAPKVAASPTASPKQDPGMAASNAGASLATQTSEGLLPDILIGGPSVRRVR